MRRLEFQLEQDCLDQGMQTIISLIVRNPLPEPIYNLTFDLHTSQNIQLLGKKRLKCDYLKSGEIAIFKLALIGVSPGSGELQIDEVVARVLGKREELSPVILPLIIQEPIQVSHNAIRVLHHPPRLKENSREILRFEVQNHSPLHLEPVEISIGGQDWAVRGTEPSLFIQSVKAGESYVFPVHVMPVQAGRIELDLHLYGMTGNQPYNHRYTFEYQVDADPRPRIQHTEIKTGDIMNLRGVLSLTGDGLDSSTTPLGKQTGPVFQSGQSQQPEHSRVTRCPRCGRETENRNYCNNCGERL